MISHEFTADESHTGTILTSLRRWMPGASWSEVKKLLRGRRVAINGVLCLDEARRLTPGETVTVTERPLPPPPTDDDVVVRYIDADIVVVEKPSGMLTLRRASEQGWTAKRRALQPTLDEVVPRLIARHAARKSGSRLKRRRPKLYPVHRIDRDTSGLLVFARNDAARQKLIQQFAGHEAVRMYLALIPGHLPSQTIRTQLIRDRGDGLRGSTDDVSIGEHAITHFTHVRRIGRYSEIQCRLETGRTNQIRIHLAELGHPVCGDIKYRGPLGRPPLPDDSGSPRLTLHSARLRFTHPESGKPLDYESPWPVDMQRLIERLAAEGKGKKAKVKR